MARRAYESVRRGLYYEQYLGVNYFENISKNPPLYDGTVGGGGLFFIFNDYSILFAVSQFLSSVAIATSSSASFSIALTGAACSGRDGVFLVFKVLKNSIMGLR